MKFHFLILIAILLSGHSSLAAMKVVSLHPLIGDVARRVGGEQVVVVDLLTEKDDPHHFSLRAADLRRSQGAKAFLASGKGLEAYLPKLKKNLPDGAELFEVGSWVPSLEVSEVCNHDHGHQHAGHEHVLEDPHWWHGIGQMRRVTLRLGVEFARLDPENAKSYRDNAANFAKELSELSNWARLELAEVPKEQRTLATSHSAFGYFCDEFDFAALPVQGLTADLAPSADRLRELTERLKKSKVIAVFPESGVNPKILEALGKSAGVKIGDELNADGMSSDYVAFTRGNVETIVRALTK